MNGRTNSPRALALSSWACMTVLLAFSGDASIARAAPAVAVGDVLSERYRLDELLGEGGMGIVFAATDLVRKQPVAVKWLAPEIRNETYASMRLMREYEALSRIDHPNVVRVHRIARHKQRYYLVMELLQGESLDAVIERGPLQPEAALALLLPALQGVAAAHAQGVVHRDIKPGNIFVSSSADGTKQVKVIDFGLSMLGEEADAKSPKLTRHGSTLGTPSYMAPEQIRGTEGVDQRADLYSFGVVLYELLSGRLPFEAEDYNNTIIEVSTGTPKPLEELRPGLPEALYAVVAKAMARDPAERFADIHALHAALVQLQQAESRAPKAEPAQVSEGHAMSIEAQTRAKTQAETRAKTEAITNSSLATLVPAGALGAAVLLLMALLIARRRAQRNDG